MYSISHMNTPQLWSKGKAKGTTRRRLRCVLTEVGFSHSDLITMFIAKVCTCLKTICEFSV